MTNDGLVRDTARRVFADSTDDAATWRELDQLGFTSIGVPVAIGGSGGSLMDLCDLLCEAGRSSVGTPLADACLAGWLLADAGLDLPEASPALLSPFASELTFRGSLDGRGLVEGAVQSLCLPDSSSCVVVVVDVDGHAGIALAPRTSFDLAARANLAGESVHTGTVRVDTRVVALRDIDLDALIRRGSLARTALMVGAATAATDLTIDYASQRRQFGRSIDRFQAVQRHLATLVSSLTELEVVLQAARDAEASHPARFEIAAGRILAADAARNISVAAHQVHGAIGITTEYSLHHHTRRLMNWSYEYGSTVYWLDAVAAAVDLAGADGLYPLIAGGTRGSDTQRVASWG